MENVTCPYCGATVEAERWKTFETCPHCGREYSVSVAASITDGASVAGLRAALDGAAEGGDYASLKAAARRISAPCRTIALRLKPIARRAAMKTV